MSFSSPSVLFRYALLFLVAGICVSSLFPTGSFHLVFTAAVFFSGVAGILFWKENALRSVLLLLLACSLGLARGSAEWLEKDSSSFLVADGAVHSFVGEVADDPVPRARLVRIQLLLEGTHQTILVYTDFSKEYHRGDKLRVSCVLERMKRSDTQGRLGTPLRFTETLSCFRPTLSFLPSGGAQQTGNALFRTKDFFSSTLEKTVQQPHVSLLKGLLFGSRGSIPSDMREDFSRVGLSHIIAVSGYNISLLVFLVARALSVFSLSRKSIFILTLCGISSFVYMIGAPPSAVRAALMGVFALFAGVVGRKSSGTTALLCSGAVMALIDPLVLFDIGFQLSYAATFGLVRWSHFAERFSSTPHFSAIFGIFIQTTIATLWTLPLLVSSFGAISVMTLFSNMLVLPVIALLMALGGLLMVINPFLTISFLFPFVEPVSSLLSWCVWLVSEYVFQVASTLSSVSWASLSFSFGQWSFGIVILLYGIFILLEKLLTRMERNILH